MNKSEDLIILYGSQTGNSQDLSERIWRKAKCFKLTTYLRSFDRFDFHKLNNTRIKLLCVCSTTGQGDLPDNMSKFWKKIMKKNLPSDILQNVEFGIIGLGDSSYEKYNFIAKKLYKRLIQLGATALLELCLCDDQQSDGIETTYTKWIDNFWLALNVNSSLITNNEVVSKYKVEFLSETQTIEEIEAIELEASSSKPFYAHLVKNDRVTHKEHFQDTRLIEFDCSNTTRIKYEPGDVLLLRPNNLKENVKKFLEIFSHLKLNLEQKIKIIPNYENEIENDLEISEEFIKTVGDLIEKYFDLNSVPRFSFFEILSKLARDEMEKEKLQEFLTPEGLEDLYNYCYRPKRKIIEIFHDFPKTSANILSLEILLDLIPSIKPRSFSIASSPFVHKDRLQILVAVVEYKTRLYETRKGTCSYWLSTLNPELQEIRIPLWIKKGSFKLDYKKPLICIGPGTGVAPFRSIINERIYKYDYNQNYLYFGCRSKSMDYYFEQEWSDTQDNHPNYLGLHTAFSRDQTEKIYVQDLLLENSSQIYDLIHNKDAFILIAGNSKRMPEDVIAILEKIIAENFSLSNKNEKSEDFANSYISKLKNSQRIQLETWS